jgi:hypothetical protein
MFSEKWKLSVPQNLRSPKQKVQETDSTSTMTGITPEVQMMDTKGKWNIHKRPTRGQVLSLQLGKEFKDTALYYANLIDYFRVVLSLAALLVIMLKPSAKIIIAAMIMGNVLLDWVDGPVSSDASSLWAHNTM